MLNAVMLEIKASNEAIRYFLCLYLFLVLLLINNRKMSVMFIWCYLIFSF